MEYWKISDFAKEVGKHQNTVDGWFKQLEEKKIHWVNRSEYGEKVYNTLDMKIAKYIKEKREDKWALDAIFHELTNHFELRPVPEETTSELQTLDLKVFRNEMESVFANQIANQISEIEKSIQESAAAQMDEMKKYYESMIKQLPQPKSVQEERQERVTEMVTRLRIERQLEKEALNMWSKKPKNERMLRVGLFLKEDRDKRDEFVKDYIAEHYESKLKKEFDLESDEY